MLDEWLRTLEREKQEAIDKLRNVCTDEETLDLATKEININYVTAMNFLTRMAEKSYTLNDDLSRVKEQYDGITDYRRFYAHLENHLARLRKIPTQVEMGTFKHMFMFY